MDGMVKPERLKSTAPSSLDDMKAGQALAIDVAGKTTITDRIIIATGDSSRRTPVWMAW